MSRPMAPRGHLPARVYWVRRGLVLGVALLLVFGIARVLTAFGGSDAPPESRAVVAGQPVEPDLPEHQPGVVLTPRAGGATSAPLSQPDGTCQTSDLLVQPDVTEVPGGSTVKLSMVVTTSGSACTWTVSPRTLGVKNTSGDEKVWSSQDCPGSIRRRDVVVRPADESASRVNVTWGGHRSAAGCAGGQAWARPGWFHIIAASLGGEPSDVQFRLTVPAAPVITQTPTPTATPTRKPTATPSKTPSKTPSRTPSKTPTKKPSASPSGR